MIREYLPADVDAIFAICKASPEAAQWAKENYERAEANGQIILVAEDAGKILGFLVARVVAKEAEILNMAVDPGHRRQGTGSMLLLAAEEASAHTRCETNVSGGPRIERSGPDFLRETRFQEGGEQDEVLRDAYGECLTDGKESHRLELKYQWFPLDVASRSAIFRLCSVNKNPDPQC